MARLRRSTAALGLIASCLIPAQSASSSETVTYIYDARGRLVIVARSGTVNNGVKACYAYDKAENRSNVTVLMSGECASGPTPSNFSFNNMSATEVANLLLTVAKSGTASTSSNGTATGATGGAPISDSQGVGTINDDDESPGCPPDCDAPLVMDGGPETDPSIEASKPQSRP